MRPCKNTFLIFRNTTYPLQFDSWPGISAASEIIAETKRFPIRPVPICGYHSNRKSDRQVSSQRFHKRLRRSLLGQQTRPSIQNPCHPVRHCYKGGWRHCWISARFGIRRIIALLFNDSWIHVAGLMQLGRLRALCVYQISRATHSTLLPLQAMQQSGKSLFCFVVLDRYGQRLSLADQDHELLASGDARVN
jgi:hypothetical protein